MEDPDWTRRTYALEDIFKEGRTVYYFNRWSFLDIPGIGMQFGSLKDSEVDELGSTILYIWTDESPYHPKGDVKAFTCHRVISVKRVPESSQYCDAQIEGSSRLSRRAHIIQFSSRESLGKADSIKIIRNPEEFINAINRHPRCLTLE
jgi:hypothetical protein